MRLQIIIRFLRCGGPDSSRLAGLVLSESTLDVSCASRVHNRIAERKKSSAHQCQRQIVTPQPFQIIMRLRVRVRLAVRRAIECHVRHCLRAQVEGTGKMTCFLRAVFFLLRSPQTEFILILGRTEEASETCWGECRTQFHNVALPFSFRNQNPPTGSDPNGAGEKMQHQKTSSCHTREHHRCPASVRRYRPRTCGPSA